MRIITADGRRRYTPETVGEERGVENKATPSLFASIGGKVVLDDSTDYSVGVQDKTLPDRPSRVGPY